MIKVPTIKFSQLLASVKEDLKKYDREGLIDPIRLIKVVRRCNQVLGVSIYNSKSCVIPIKDYRGELPLDFYQLEMAFAVSFSRYYSSPMALGLHYEWTTIQSACMCEGTSAVCVTPIEQNQPTIKYTSFTPVTLTNNTLNNTCGYSPNRNWKSQFNIDISEGTLTTSFKEGLLYFTYLADLVDENTGEILVPFHGKLNDYYEWSLKKKIFEDLFMDTDENVQGKLQYASNEAALSFTEAVDFVMSKSYIEHSQMRQAREKKFYNQHVKIFY